MNTRQIKLYYLYFIPITILQSLATLLLMSVLSVRDYGVFTIYQTNINFFFFLSLGLQLGYTLKLPSLGDDDIKGYTNSINLFTNILIVIYVVIIIALNSIMMFNDVLLVSLLSASVFVLFIVQKAIFQTNYQIHSLNIYIILFRVIFLLDVLLYIIIEDIIMVLWLDMIFRVVVTILGNINMIFKYGVPKIKHIKIFQSDIKSTIRLGVPIMIGNWLTMIYLLADKYVLSDMPIALGQYSFAITSVLLVRVLATPIKDLLFVHMSKKDDNNELYRLIKVIVIIGLLLSVFGSVAATLVIKYTKFLDQYQVAIPSLYILLSIIPISLLLDVILFNKERVASGKRYLIKTILSAVVMFTLLKSYVLLSSSFELVEFSLLVVVSYNVIFLFFSNNIENKVVRRKTVCTIFALQLMYLVIIYTLI